MCTYLSNRIQCLNGYMTVQYVLRYTPARTEQCTVPAYIAGIAWPTT